MIYFAIFGAIIFGVLALLILVLTVIANWQEEAESLTGENE